MDTTEDGVTAPGQHGASRPVAVVTALHVLRNNPYVSEEATGATSTCRVSPLGF